MKCKKCSSDKIVLVEYDHSIPQHIDGWSEIRCLNCGVRIGRWSEKELEDNELEERYGGAR